MLSGLCGGSRVVPWLRKLVRAFVPSPALGSQLKRFKSRFGDCAAGLSSGYTGQYGTPGSDRSGDSSAQHEASELLKETFGYSTIRDVARLAGVSIATVSAVVNGKNSVSKQMTQRVEDAMRALDYHPHHMARSLKTGRSKVVGMVIPDLTNPFFVELMCGVEETARNAGYSVIFSNSNEDPAQERA